MFLINPYILQASGNPLWDGLLAYYTADNTGNDATDNGNNLTLVNGTTYDTGIINNGFSFDGVNDSAQYSGDIGVTGDVSFSFWFEYTGTSAQGLIQSFNTRSLANGSFNIHYTNNKVYVQTKSTTGSFYTQQSITNLTASTLYHIVVTYDSTTEIADIYINDSLDANSNYTHLDSTTSDFANGFDVGMRRTNLFLNGKMDEIGIWNRVLSSSEVTELYNSGAGKQYPTGINALWNDLLAYYTADNTPNDALGNFNGTLTNGATYGTGIINNGFSLDGVNDYVDLPNGSFAPTGDFSLSCWCYFDTITGWVLNFGDYSTTEGIVLYIASNKMTGLVADGAFQITQGATTLSTSTWYHVVFTSSSTNGTNLYLNNSVDKYLPLNTKTPTYGATEFARIGARANNSNYVNGIIDEVALFEKELTAAEVTELYNAGAGKQYPN